MGLQVSSPRPTGCEAKEPQQLTDALEEGAHRPFISYCLANISVLETHKLFFGMYAKNKCQDYLLISSTLLQCAPLWDRQNVLIKHGYDGQGTCIYISTEAILFLSKEVLLWDFILSQLIVRKKKINFSLRKQRVL